MLCDADLMTLYVNVLTLICKERIAGGYKRNCKSK